MHTIHAIQPSTGHQWQPRQPLRGRPMRVPLIRRSWHTIRPHPRPPAPEMYQGGGGGLGPPSSRGSPCGPCQRRAKIVEAQILLAPKAPKQNFGGQPQTLEGDEGGPGGVPPLLLRCTAVLIHQCPAPSQAHQLMEGLPSVGQSPLRHGGARQETGPASSCRRAPVPAPLELQQPKSNGVRRGGRVAQGGGQGGGGGLACYAPAEGDRVPIWIWGPILRLTGRLGWSTMASPTTLHIGRVPGLCCVQCAGAGGGVSGAAGPPPPPPAPPKEAPSTGPPNPHWDCHPGPQRSCCAPKMPRH